jgi:hypothetical protein
MHVLRLDFEGGAGPPLGRDRAGRRDAAGAGCARNRGLRCEAAPWRPTDAPRGRMPAD